MDPKLTPFAGAELYRATVERTRVVNFVWEKFPPGSVALYVHRSFGGPSFMAGYYNAKAIDTLISVVRVYTNTKLASSYIYVASSVPVLPAILVAMDSIKSIYYSESFIASASGDGADMNATTSTSSALDSDATQMSGKGKGGGKKGGGKKGCGKKGGGKKKKLTPPPLNFAIAKPVKRVKFESMLLFWTAGMKKYDLKLTLQFSPGKELVPTWLYCSQFGDSDPISRVMGRNPKWHLLDAPCSSIDLRITGSSQEDLFHLIEEELSEVSAGVLPTSKQVVKGLENIYCDPVACALLEQHGVPYPTVESLTATPDILKTQMEECGKGLWSRLVWCSYKIRIPPIRSEQALAFQTKLEYRLDPSILDTLCTLARFPPSTNDPLYDKILTFLPEGTTEKKSSSIEFDYGALVDLGQIFSYGEMAELSGRLTIE